MWRNLLNPIDTKVEFSKFQNLKKVRQPSEENRKVGRRIQEPPRLKKFENRNWNEKMKKEIILAKTFWSIKIVINMCRKHVHSNQIQLFVSGLELNGLQKRIDSGLTELTRARKFEQERLLRRYHNVDEKQKSKNMKTSKTGMVKCVSRHRFPALERSFESISTFKI